MTTPRKTATEISAILVAQLESSFNQTIPLLPKAFNRILAKVCGLIFVALFQFAGFIALQMFVKYASSKEMTIGGMKFTPLQLWGQMAGLTQGTGARSTGTTTVPVLTTGGTLQSGTTLVNEDTEELYLTIGDTALSASTVTPVVRAVNYSAAADLDVGQKLSFVSAPDDVEKETTVATVTVDGADPEDPEDFRARIIQFFAARPQGGAYADYWEWGTEVDGVKDIFPYSGGTPAIPTSGPGQVDIFVEADAGDGTASGTLQTSVYDNIEVVASSGLASRRPIGAYVNVDSIYLTTVDVTVSGLDVDAGLVVSTKADIVTAVTAYLRGRKNYIVGLSYPPRKDIIMASEAAGIAARVAAANGGLITGLSFSISSTPYDIYSLSEGEQVRIGTTTWS